MDLGSLAEVVSTLAVLAGLVFAAVQLRYFRLAREREAALELVHSFQTPEFAKALFVLNRLPDGLGKAELEARLGGEAESLYVLFNSWESLGLLVYRGELSLQMVDDLFSGPILVSWRKLRRFVEDSRAEQDRETYHEWFQWLAERMEECEARSPPVPAHRAYRELPPRRRRAAGGS